MGPEGTEGTQTRKGLWVRGGGGAAGGGRRGAHTCHRVSNSRQEDLGPTSGTPISPRSRGVRTKDKSLVHASPLGNTVVRAVGSRSDVLVLLQRRLTVV